MAKKQAAMHRQRLQEYEAIVRGISKLPDTAFALATLQMGLRYEEASIAFWEDIAKRSPSTISSEEDTEPEGS
jgi:hypothetical protein